MTQEELKPLFPARLGNVTFKQVRAFLAAAEHQSFSLAAQKVFQSQPSFSRCIKELEWALGEELFARLPRGVQLSAFGEAFIPHALRMQACLTDVQSVMSHWRRNRQPKLLLAGTQAVLPVILPTLMRCMREGFDLPPLDFEEGSDDQVVAAVLAGRATMGVLTSHIADPRLHCEPVLDAPLGLLAAPDCPLPPVIRSLADLKGDMLIRLGDDAVITQLLKRCGVVFDAYFDASLKCSTVAASLPLVRHEGRAVIASGVGATHPQAHDFRFIPLPELLPTIRVSIISRKDLPFDKRRHVTMELVLDSILATQWHASVRRMK